MDKQEFLTFIDSYIKFQERCKNIAKILTEYNSDFYDSRLRTWIINYDGHHPYDSHHARDKFDCYTEVYIHPSSSLELRPVCFPVELLSATDEQIHLYAQEKYNK